MRRKRNAEMHATGQNLRAGAESMIRSLKHPFRNGKLPVRGKPRVNMMVIASAAMTNIRRIHGYHEKLREAVRKARAIHKQIEEATKNVFVSFCGLLHRRLIQRPYSKTAVGVIPN